MAHHPEADDPSGRRDRLQPQRHHAGADRRQGLPAADELDTHGAADPRDDRHLPALRAQARCSAGAQPGAGRARGLCLRLGRRGQARPARRRAGACL